jgi:predicted outer membrane repeat protein
VSVISSRGLFVNETLFSSSYAASGGAIYVSNTENILIEKSGFSYLYASSSTGGAIVFGEKTGFNVVGIDLSLCFFYM